MRRSQAGQITAMLVLFAICLLLTIIAVTDVSAAYLRRQSATSLADGAALAATTAATAGVVYGSADDRYVDIDQASASAAVEQYLRDTGAYQTYPGLQCAVGVRGHVVTVQLTMPFKLPVPVPGVAASTLVHGSGSAELPIYQ
ncbi:MAG: pilus assembly protein TadG-related protein [Nocardioidaceae bacterium]